jgi:ATP-dependent Clp protease ATP-binding subunit ClpB
MNDIVSIQLENLVSILKSQSINLSCSEKALAYLAEKGFDPLYGARPLKRVIQRDIQNTLAKKLLSGEIMPNASIMIDYENSELRFK